MAFYRDLIGTYVYIYTGNRIALMTKDLTGYCDLIGHSDLVGCLWEFLWDSSNHWEYGCISPAKTRDSTMKVQFMIAKLTYSLVN
jgi:hypothetical protein